MKATEQYFLYVVLFIFMLNKVNLDVESKDVTQKCDHSPMKLYKMVIIALRKLPLIISSNKTCSIHREDPITKTKTAILKLKPRKEH